MNREEIATRIEEAKRPDGGIFFAHVINAAVKLGIFRTLQRRPMALCTFAEYHELDEGALQRLIALLCAVGYIEKGKDGLLYNTALGYAADFMDIPSPVGPPTPLLALFPFLAEAIEEGGPQMYRAFPEHGHGDIFSSLYADPERLEGFCRYMLKSAIPIGKEIAAFFPVSLACQLSILDIGGGLGGLLIELITAQPHLRGTIMELPAVAALARKYLKESGHAGQITVVEADFFKGWFPRADAAVLSWILHDWNDEHCRQILRRTFEALPSGGLLLISECVLKDCGVNAVYPLMLSIAILLAQERGARERTESEFISLIEGAGFKNVSFRKTAVQRDLIVARKP